MGRGKRGLADSPHIQELARRSSPPWSGSPEVTIKDSRHENESAEEKVLQQLVDAKQWKGEWMCERSLELGCRNRLDSAGVHLSAPSRKSWWDSFVVK